MKVEEIQKEFEVELRKLINVHIKKTRNMSQPEEREYIRKNRVNEQIKELQKKYQKKYEKLKSKR